MSSAIFGKINGTNYCDINTMQKILFLCGTKMSFFIWTKVLY